MTSLLLRLGLQTIVGQGISSEYSNSAINQQSNNPPLKSRLNMIINKQKQVREVNKPVKVLFPFRQIAIRTRVLHRLNPQELMIRRGF